MELKWLEDFVCLANIGSFWKASEERHVSQPALSRRIRALEDWLGVTLIDRSTYPVTLTPFGRQFLPYAQDILRTSKGIREEFRLLAGAGGDEVRIATLHTLSMHLLPQLIEQLLQVHPKAKTVIIPSMQGIEHHFDALASGIVHLLVTYGGQPIAENVAHLDSFEERLVGADELLPVASPSLAERASLGDFNAAKAIPFLAYSSFSFTEKLVVPVARSLGDRLRVVCESGLSETIAALARRGLGMAWLPRSVIEADLARGELVVVGGDDLRVPLAIKVYRSKASRSPVVEAMWSLLESGVGAKTT
jgi:DNA-binding transcriptional LysR family regulator